VGFIKPAPAPTKTRTRGCGCGFPGKTPGFPVIFPTFRLGQPLDLEAGLHMWADWRRVLGLYLSTSTDLVRSFLYFQILMMAAMIAGQTFNFSCICFILFFLFNSSGLFPFPLFIQLLSPYLVLNLFTNHIFLGQVFAYGHIQLYSQL
jgi:hypothetical protein